MKHHEASPDQTTEMTFKIKNAVDKLKNLTWQLKKSIPNIGQNILYWDGHKKYAVGIN